MRTREKSKAQLVKEVKELTALNEQQVLDIGELVSEKGRISHLVNLVSKERDDLRAAYNKCCSERSAAEQLVKDKEQELQTRVHLHEGNVKRLQDKVDQLSRFWDKERDRVIRLERLLVCNAKAIGGLSDLAAEKYKNDDLPF